VFLFYDFVTFFSLNSLIGVNSKLSENTPREQHFKYLHVNRQWKSRIFSSNKICSLNEDDIGRSANRLALIHII